MHHHFAFILIFKILKNNWLECRRLSKVIQDKSSEPLACPVVARASSCRKGTTVSCVSLPEVRLRQLSIDPSRGLLLIIIVCFGASYFATICTIGLEMRDVYIGTERERERERERFILS